MLFRSSALSDWARSADKVVMIDGCSLRCHGRIMENLIGQDKLAQFDALSRYKKYTDRFDIDSVPPAMPTSARPPAIES